MIINKLEMYNFRQYIGHQIVDFSADKEKNVTVLIGVNTSGKTTLVRAFEWCLYGKNGFEDNVLLNSDVRQNMHVSDIQETWVSVNFTHNEKVYTLKRLVRYICNACDATASGKVTVSVNRNPEEILTLEYLQNDGQTKTPIDKRNITESMDRVLPKDLSDYFFFGGERISSIANRTDLSKAVRGLMRLDVLENARIHLSKVIKQFESGIDTSGDATADKAKNAIETYKQQLKQHEKDKSDADSQMNYYLEKEKGLNAQLANSNVEQVRQAKAEYNRIQKNLSTKNGELERCISGLVSNFNYRPFVFFGMPALNRALMMLDKLKDSTECVPDMHQNSIDYLVKRGCCLCGTYLTEGSLPFIKVMEERRKLPPEHIGATVNNYKNKVDGYIAGSSDFLTNIENKYKEIRFVKRQIQELEDQLEKQKGLILDDTDAKKLEEQKREAHQAYLDAKHDYDVATQNIGTCKTNIRYCEDTIDRYAKGSKKNEKLYKRIAYSKAVYNWINDTYMGKEGKVRAELQNRVNNNFKAMYHGERSIFIDDKYRVNYDDVKTEESDGLKAVKSFAFIASLVSMAKDKILDDEDMKLGQVYPLVMDAPFSNVDEIHIENICKILPRTANQVIIAVMQKDWDYAADKLSRYVGVKYSIVKDKDVDGKEIETSTHIHREDF